MLVGHKDEFMKHMKECGIMVSQVHERNDIHSCVKEYSTHLPSLDWITPRLISIPVGWWVTEKIEDTSLIVSKRLVMYPKTNIPTPYPIGYLHKLYDYVIKHKPKTIVEFGSGWGSTTIHMRKARNLWW